MSELPAGWVNSSLSRLVASNGLFSDGDWVESKDQDPNGTTRLLQLADIGDGYFVDKSSRFINDEKFVELRCTELLENDVLIARMPDPLGRACLMPKLPQRCVTVVDVAVFRPGKESVSSNWLMHTINAPQFRTEIEMNSSGTTRKRISRGNLAVMALPVPPLPEQIRIADKLDTVLARVDACRDRLDRLPTLLKRFRQSILAAATSGRLTGDWRKGCAYSVSAHRFEDIIEESVTGLVRATNEQFIEGEDLIPYVKMNNVNEDWGCNESGLVRVRCTSTEYERYALRVGDWLFNTRNSVELVGKSCVWNGAPYVFNNNLLRVRFKTSVSSPYVEIWFRSPKGRDILSTVKSATTSVAAIYQRSLMALTLELPSLEEQHEIVRRVEILFAFADRLEARLSTARKQVDQLTPALLAKAFRGELVPQDPADEPASELLKRLAAAGKDSPPKARRGKVRAAV